MSKYLYPNPNFIFYKKLNNYIITDIHSGKQLYTNTNQSIILDLLLIKKENFDSIQNIEKEDFYNNILKYNLGFFTESLYGFEPTRGFSYNSYQSRLTINISTIHINLSLVNKEVSEYLLKIDNLINLKINNIVIYIYDLIKKDQLQLILNTLSKKTINIYIYDYVHMTYIDLLLHEIKNYNPDCSLTNLEISHSNLENYCGFNFLPIDSISNNPFQVNNKLYGNVFIDKNSEILNLNSTKNMTKFIMNKDNISYWYDIEFKKMIVEKYDNGETVVKLCKDFDLKEATESL